MPTPIRLSRGRCAGKSVGGCLSVCLSGWMDGWGGGLFFVLFLPLVKFKQYAVTRTKCHFPAIHLNLASILKLTFDLLKC